MINEYPASSPVLTCAVLDDDEINRFTLEHYIKLNKSLKLVASLSGSVEGLEFFSNDRRVDVLFLDVEMPDLNGLDMLRLLPEPPQVVLTTAHDDFVWEAFELRIVDYLVKPFDYSRSATRCQADSILAEGEEIDVVLHDSVLYYAPTLVPITWADIPALLKKLLWLLVLATIDLPFSASL